MIAIFINLVFLFFIYFFFNHKIKKTLSLKKLHFEINQLISSFNRNLEKKILLIEDSFKDFEINKKKLDREKVELKKLLKEIKSIDKNKTIYIKPKEELRPSNEIKKITNNNFPSKNILRDDIIFFYKNGLSEKKIAKKLALSVEEVKLNLIK